MACRVLRALVWTLHGTKARMGKGVHNSFINQALVNYSSFIVPILYQAEEELRGEVNMGAMDATVHKKKAREYDIRSFPTIKYFAPGDKQKSYFPALDAIEYEGVVLPRKLWIGL